jgi:hypothetical protein
MFIVYSSRWLEHFGLSKQILAKLQLIPDLPMNKIKIEISSFLSNKWIYVPGKEEYAFYETNDKNENITRDIENDPFPLLDVKQKALSRNYFGCCMGPIKMDERIIESGLRVLECNRAFKSQRETEKMKKAYRDVSKHWMT